MAGLYFARRISSHLQGTGGDQSGAGFPGEQKVAQVWKDLEKHRLGREIKSMRFFVIADSADPVPLNRIATFLRRSISNPLNHLFNFSMNRSFIAS